MPEKGKVYRLRKAQGPRLVMCQFCGGYFPRWAVRLSPYGEPACPACHEERKHHWKRL